MLIPLERPVPRTERFRQALETPLDRGFRQRTQRGDGLVGPPARLGLGRSGDLVFAQRIDLGVEQRRILTRGDAGDTRVDPLTQRLRLGITVCGAATEEEEGHGDNPGSQIGARTLPGGLSLRRQVDHVVDQLECHADPLTVVGDGVGELRRCVREHHAHARGGRDQRARLVGEHLQVVLHRIVPGLRADRLVQLAEAQSLKGACLEQDRLLPHARDERRGAGEEQIAGKDRHRVRPHRLGGRDATAKAGVIHDVVVVERGKVGDLDGLRGAAHQVVRAVAELAREERQHRSDPLASRLRQVARGGVGDLGGEAEVLEQADFNKLELFLHALRMAAIGDAVEQPHGKGLGRRVAGDRHFAVVQGVLRHDHSLRPSIAGAPSLALTTPTWRCRASWRSQPSSEPEPSWPLRVS